MMMMAVVLGASMTAVGFGATGSTASPGSTSTGVTADAVHVLGEGQSLLERHG